MTESTTDSRGLQDVNFKLLYTLKGHTNAVSSVKFSPSGDYLASAGYDKLINIWDVNTGDLETSCSSHQQGISEVDWSRNGRLLVSASDDTTVKIWNARIGHCERTLKGHEKLVFCTRFSPEHLNLIASGSDDFTVKLWDVETGACVNTLRNHYDRIVSVDFHPIQHLVLSASHDGFCFLHDLRTNLPAVAFKFDCYSDDLLSFVNFSPNGLYLLVARLNEPLSLWQVNKKQLLKEYKGHQNSEFCLSSSFFGKKYVVSGSEDKHIYVWKNGSQTLVQTIEGHTDVVICVDAKADRNLIASGSLENDQTVKVWKL